MSVLCLCSKMWDIPTLPTVNSLRCSLLSNMSFPSSIFLYNPVEICTYNHLICIYEDLKQTLLLVKKKIIISFLEILLFFSVCFYVKLLGNIKLLILSSILGKEAACISSRRRLDSMLKLVRNCENPFRLTICNQLSYLRHL